MSDSRTGPLCHNHAGSSINPEFGRAYSGLGASLLRLGRRDEAQKNWDEALRRVDRMTEREKLRTSGGYYLGRRGEATSLFLDDLPTFRYYATLPYWLGRAREMQKLDARPQLQEFLKIRQGATADPLVDDARKRLDAVGK